MVIHKQRRICLQNVRVQTQFSRMTTGWWVPFILSRFPNYAIEKTGANNILYIQQSVSRIGLYNGPSTGCVLGCEGPLWKPRNIFKQSNNYNILDQTVRKCTKTRQENFIRTIHRCDVPATVNSKRNMTTCCFKFKDTKKIDVDVADVLARRGLRKPNLWWKIKK